MATISLSNLGAFRFITYGAPFRKGNTGGLTVFRDLIGTLSNESRFD